MQIFNLPDLNTNPNTFLNYIINNKSYTFQFQWSGDHAICTAYFVANNQNVYLFKGRAITINSDLISRVNDSDKITGSLFVVNKFGQNVEPEQHTFSSDFQLVYVP